MKPIAVVLVVVQLVFAGLWSPALAQDEDVTPAIKGHKEPVSKEERKEIETLMRGLLRSIHSRSYAAILRRISESYGIQTGGDSHVTKSEFEEELRNPNSSAHKDLFSMPEREVILRCKEGEKHAVVLVSLYAYYEEFGEQYTVHITKTVYEVNGKREIFYDVAPGFQTSKSGCLYMMFPLGLQRIDGILYWTTWHR